MFSRRLFLSQLLVLLTACQTAESPSLGQLTIGVVSYDEAARSIEQYSPLRDHLSAQLKSIIELEPAFNEVRALEQIHQKVWSLVFAPPGLAAVAISEENYTPLFPLEGVENIRPVIVMREDSPIKKLTDLEGKVIALGQVGSATGYYLPIYNLHGLTLAEVRFAPTPKTMLEWIEKGEVEAGAMALADLNQYSSQLKSTQFRVLYIGSVPPGAILVGPTVERNQQEQIRKALQSAPPNAIAAAGYLPNAKVPEYKQLIDAVARVRAITKRLKEKPARLY
jgi:phosphonate transport system substrate-binding protein